MPWTDNRQQNTKSHYVSFWTCNRTRRRWSLEIFNLKLWHLLFSREYLANGFLYRHRLRNWSVRSDTFLPNRIACNSFQCNTFLRFFLELDECIYGFLTPKPERNTTAFIRKKKTKIPINSNPPEGFVRLFHCTVYLEMISIQRKTQLNPFSRSWNRRAKAKEMCKIHRPLQHWLNSMPRDVL